MLFFSYFAALLAVGAFCGIFIFYLLKDRIMAGCCLVAFPVLALASTVSGNSYAASLGFRDNADMNYALAAGVNDPGQWAALKQKQQENQRVSEGLDAATKSGRLTLIGALKNPWSASINASRAHVSGGHIVVCGTVNAKNSFDIYTGYKMFAVYVDTGAVMIEGAENEDWKTNCN